MVGYVAADLALVQLGRTEYLYLVARDPRYVTDALVVVAIGVSAAFSGPRSSDRPPAASRGPSGRRVPHWRSPRSWSRAAS